MNIHALSSSFSFPQPSVKGHESNHHSSKDRGLEGEKNRSLMDHDSFQPSRRLETGGKDVVNSKMSLQAISTHISHTADIQITTKEGDVVTISLNESLNSGQSKLKAEQGDDNIDTFNKNTESVSGFAISIEGDLNKDEQESLAKLINKMSKVTDKFFKGNTQAAFKHAQKVGFDTEQIAGFSMDLRQEKSVQAVTAYQQTAMPEQNINPDLLKQAGDFVAKTKDYMADTGAMLDSIAQPKQAFTDLFAGILQMNVNSGLESENGQPLFMKMIKNIGNDIFDDKSEKSQRVT